MIEILLMVQFCRFALFRSKRKTAGLSHINGYSAMLLI